MGSERLRALSKEQLLDYLLCIGQNERRDNEGIGKFENSERVQKLRSATTLKLFDDGKLSGEARSEQRSRGQYD